ncbi:sel1 repeat family protein [Vibrio parahaemolyticus]|nr:sel1 repeat family protein [Vibrio parahaemolyticus]
MPMYFNQLAAKSVLLIGLTLGMVGCSRTPDPQDDIPLFKTFIAENIDKVSDDPYISSTVKPGDKMYEFLVGLQHGMVHKETYEPLIQNGDSESKLWYARLSMYDTPIVGQVYKWISEAMLEGNPYAALELSEQGEFCNVYGKDSASNSLLNMMGADTSYTSDVCSEKYFTKAVKGFEKLAAEGDLRAQYFLLKQKHWDKSKETRADYIHEIIRFAEAHYYQPLMDYVDTILYYSKETKRKMSNSKEQYDLAIQLLTIASNNNYIPAIESLINIAPKLEKDATLYLNLLRLGSPEYYASRFYKFEDEYSEKDKVCFAFAYEKITGSDTKFFIWLNNESQKFRRQGILEERTDCSLKKATDAMVYIDGFTSRDDWRDRGGS